MTLSQRLRALAARDRELIDHYEQAGEHQKADEALAAYLRRLKALSLIDALTA